MNIQFTVEAIGFGYFVELRLSPFNWHLSTYREDAITGYLTGFVTYNVGPFQLTVSKKGLGF